MNLLRANSHLYVGFILFAILSLILVGIGVLLASNGGTARPAIFFAAFGGVIVFPLVLKTIAELRTTRGAESERAGRLRVVDRRLADRAELFGDAPTHDAKAVWPDVFGVARAAELAMHDNGQTTLIAQYDKPDDAERSLAAYRPLGKLGSADRGTRDVFRDHYEVLLRDSTLYVWTARGEEDLRQRRDATPMPAPLPPGESPFVFPRMERWSSFFEHRPRGVVPMLSTVLLLSVFVFFRGAVWAATVKARPGVSPVAAASLESRLLALNDAGVPFVVSKLPDGRLAVDWNYADATWITTSRLAGVRRTHRILLRVDEPAHVVRFVEQSGSYDFSVGRGGGSIAWKREVGITFYEKRYEQTFGVLLDANGRPTGDLSYTYRFDLDEMKQPLLKMSTDAGWDWKPGLIDRAPVGLGWLLN